VEVDKPLGGLLQEDWGGAVDNHAVVVDVVPGTRAINGKRCHFVVSVYSVALILKIIV
jgi:hypothetical protein